MKSTKQKCEILEGLDKILKQIEETSKKVDEQLRQANSKIERIIKLHEEQKA